ncbi:hypothetical protein JCM8547_001453 [Rhodosporidiobolus lusitaniae]
MPTALDESGGSTRRSALNRFNPQRISFFGGNSSSSRNSPPSSPSPKLSAIKVMPATTPSVESSDASLSLTKPVTPKTPISISPRGATSSKRKAVASPMAKDAPTFTSPFTNLSPFTSPPIPAQPSFHSGRRGSAELRAVAANRMKAGVVAVETAPGKRRKSVVDLEEATEGVRTLSARRRSSLSPIQPLSGTRRRSSVSPVQGLPSTSRRRSSITPGHSLSTPARRPSQLHFAPMNNDLVENDSPRPEVPAVPEQIHTASGVPIRFPLAFPSPSPASPPVDSFELPTSPLFERRAAFSDEVLSPILSSSPPPSSRTFSSASPTPSSWTSRAPSSWRSSTFQPRSPHALPPLALSPVPAAEESPRSFESPSGVKMTWPPVFPSRPSRPTSMASIDFDCEAAAVGAASDLEEEQVEAVEIPILFRKPALPTLIRRFPPPTLSSASPFPPPFLSTREPSRESFSNFVFPSMPTLFNKTPTALPAWRRMSTASSYESAREGSESELVKTPSTFELPARSPLATGVSTYHGDVFAEAFSRAGRTSAQAEDEVEEIVQA